MPKQTRRAAVLAAEQRAVDHAYSCLERARQEAVELSGLDTAASGKDAIDSRRTWARELASLDGGGRSIVFMRADVDGDEGRETFYVGRRVVQDEQRNPVVISWSSKAAVEWRLTSEQDPGQVRLLRQIVCDQRVVRRYFDLHGSEAEQPVELEARTTEVAQDTAAGDPSWRDPLLEELDRARDGAMHDMVETIQREQLRLVADEPAGVLVVQGGPGTGKTAVGLHRVAWLLDNDLRAAKDILVIGPNRSFLEYVGVALAELGSDDVSLLELPALWAAAVPRDPRPVAAVKAHQRMAAVLRGAVDHETTSSVERLTALVGGPVFTFELNRREVVVPVKEIAEIATAALAGDSAYQVRRERCLQRITQHLTDAYVATLPGPADIDYLAETARTRPVVRLLKRICPVLTSQEVLRSLYSGGPALARAAEGILSVAEQDLLTASSSGAGPGARTPRAWNGLSREDLSCMDELDYILAGRPSKVYGHLVLDEAQDVTPMEARALARRCPSGSMTILGDLAQSTGPHLFQDWDEVGQLLAGRDGYRVAELVTGFRVPSEVMDFAARLGAFCAPHVAVPESVRTTGTEVTVVEGQEPVLQAAGAVARLRASAPGGPRARSIGVIVPEGGAWRDRMARALGPDAPESPAVLTPAEAKGLEFDHVVVVEPAEIVGNDSAGLRHLYVALTRCTQSLTVIHALPLPEQLRPPARPAAPTGRPRVDGARASRRPASAPPASGESGPPHGAAPVVVREEQELERYAEVEEDLRKPLASRMSAARTDQFHEALRHRLLADLYESTSEVGEDAFVDAWCTRADGTVLFDVLSGQESGYRAVRESALHLMEVSYLRPEGQAEFLVVVLGGGPVDPWVVDAADGAFSVLLAWRDGGGSWAGPGARHIAP
ncbi:AAA family ATPase [Streptomyces sp. NBC_00247]|uniref:HelD family protein n=1 Tax=Streptomyces sp. NBC_00247 TaxID=2975689 RepID=UPI002E2C7D65|nr:UvrD-helicase domain-containing protein [Streptomyces sp. NBC_00247]